MLVKGAIGRRFASSTGPFPWLYVVKLAIIGVSLLLQFDIFCCILFYTETCQIDDNKLMTTYLLDVAQISTKRLLTIWLSITGNVYVFRVI